MDRSDQRGDFELMVSTSVTIGKQAVRIAMRDIEAYVGSTEESMESWQDQNRATMRISRAMSRRKNRGSMPQVSTQQWLDLYRAYGLNRAEKRQLHTQLRADGYNDNEAAMVIRIASRTR